MFVFIIVVLLGENVYAFTGTWDITNYGNPSSKAFAITSTGSSNTTLNMWHYSGGYWKGTFYSGNVAGDTLQVSDDDINKITDLKFNDKDISIGIPSTVNSYAATYGWNNIRVRINSGLSGITTSNSVPYTIDTVNGKLHILPDLQLRVGGNLWAGKGWSFYLPKPLTEAYGHNVFSIFNRAGTTPTISGASLPFEPSVKFKLHSINEVRMNGSDGYLNDSLSYALEAPNIGYAGWHLRIGIGTFKNGGAQGIVWKFPFNITWYLVDPIAPSGTFSPNSSGWTNGNITTAFDPSDTGGSGVKQWRYRTSSNNGSSWSGWSGYITGDTTSNITLSSQGNWRIQTEVTDNVGNVGYPMSGNYYIDKTAPGGAFLPNSSGWTKNNITVSFNPSDSGGSGVNQWKYRTTSDNGTTWSGWSGAISGDTTSNITLFSQGIWKMQCWVQDKANNQFYITSGTYYIDKTVPGGAFSPNSSSNSILNIATIFNPSDSGGAGVKQWRYRISSNNGSTWSGWSGYIVGDLSSTINLNTIALCKVQTEVTDNAGNIGYVTSGTFSIMNPKPTNNTLSVTKYDYKESNTIYWVKPNSIFGIYTDGYFPSSFGIYPTRTYVLFAKDNLFNLTTSARQYSTTTGKTKYGLEYDTNFNWDSANTDLAIQYVSSGRNNLMATHHLSAKYDNTAYKLYHVTTYVNGSEYSNGYTDSGIWLKVDGIAPNGTVDLNYYNVTSEMKITVTNIIETGSGVNKIWAEYTDEDNPLNIKTEELTNIDGNYQGQENLYNLFSGAAETVNIKIKAIDNVGNERTLSDSDNDIFTVNANISRALEPHEPIFKSGEKGILNINVYGGVDTVKIAFPLELTTLDNTLDKQIILTPKVSDTINYEFFIPIGTQDNNYNVEVKAYKNGKEKIAYAPFTVSGNILNQLRTRIRKGN